MQKKAGTEIETSLEQSKNLNKNGYFIKLIDWNGGATPTQNSVTTETTGSVHARGKRPCNGKQFFAQQKTPFFPRRKMVFLVSVPTLFHAFIKNRS